MTRIHYPPSPQEGGKLTSRLTKSNWRRASSIRMHALAGYLRVYIVGLHYYDAGAGGFMSGRGAFVLEGRVVCESYPAAVPTRPRRPAILSKAGWGFAGPARTARGEVLELDFADPKNLKPYIDSLAGAFWTIDEALKYANGEDGGRLARHTEPIRVVWTKTGYRLTRKQA